MRRLVVVVAAVAASGALLAGGRPAPLSLEIRGNRHAQLYAIDFAVDGGRVVRFDPTTLRARPGPFVRVRDHLSGWSFSANHRLLALGEFEGGTIRLVDTAHMRLVGDVKTGLDGPMLATHWLPEGRLLAVIGRTLVVVDTVSRRVLRRTQLPSWALAVARTPTELVLLLGPASPHIGASTLVAADRDGAIRVAYLTRVAAGSEEIERGKTGLFRQVIPGLAADSQGRRAFAVTAEGLVAEVDLAAMRVMYHAVSEPRSALGRLHDWLEPNAEAKGAVVGPRRRARWLGAGAIAVWGLEDDGRLDERGVGHQHQQAAGLTVIDTRRWSSRWLDREASEAVVANGLVLASANLWDSTRRRARGMGLTAYGPDGSRRFHVLGSEALSDVEVVGGRAIVARLEAGGRVAYTVVDLERGRLEAVLRPRVSFLLLNGDASRALG